MFNPYRTPLIRLLLVMCMLLSSPVWAEDDLSNLPDPTRPDLGFKDSQDKKVDDLIGDQFSDLTGIADEELVEELPPEELVLQYTLISPKRRLAVINGKMIEEGATIAEAKIIKIRSEQVVAQRFGEQIILDLARYQAQKKELELGAEQAVGEDNVISK